MGIKLKSQCFRAEDSDGFLTMSYEKWMDNQNKLRRQLLNDMANDEVRKSFIPSWYMHQGSCLVCEFEFTTLLYRALWKCQVSSSQSTFERIESLLFMNLPSQLHGVGMPTSSESTKGSVWKHCIPTLPSSMQASRRSSICAMSTWGRESTRLLNFTEKWPTWQAYCTAVCTNVSVNPFSSKREN